MVVGVVAAATNQMMIATKLLQVVLVQHRLNWAHQRLPRLNQMIKAAARRDPAAGYSVVATNPRIKKMIRALVAAVRRD